MVNRKFAKIVDGRIVFAPAVIRVNGRTIIGGKAEHYAQAGWLPVDLSAPACPEGYHLVADGYTDAGGIIKRVWRTAQDERVPRVFSKLKIKLALAQMGILAAVESALAGIEIAPGYSAAAAFNDAQVIAEDFDGLADIIARFKAAYGKTDAEVDAFLDSVIAD